jgi:hypothetical protein
MVIAQSPLKRLQSLRVHCVPWSLIKEREIQLHVALAGVLDRYVMLSTYTKHMYICIDIRREWVVR